LQPARPPAPWARIGASPSPCPISPAAGKEYAINQLVLFLAITSLACDWERTRTEKSGQLHPCGHCHHACCTRCSHCYYWTRWLHCLSGQFALRLLPAATTIQSSHACPPSPAPSDPLLAADLMAYLPTIYPHDSLIAIRPRGSAK
jgi:hypothetical protein